MFVKHTATSLCNQFFGKNTLFRKKSRSIGLLIPDNLHRILTLQEIVKERKTSWIFKRNELKYGIIFVISGFILGKVIFR